MSLSQYQQLQTNMTKDDIGLNLPTLNASNLVINAKRCDKNQLIAAIVTFAPEQGWTLYRDQLTTDLPLGDNSDIIEGQYCKSQNNQIHSLHIRLLGNDLYQLTYFNDNQDAPNSTQYCYNKQQLVVRTNLSGNTKAPKVAHYRLWWQQPSSGPQTGRWLAHSQQFIGFTQEA